jgi:hypothetical protein
MDLDQLTGRYRRLKDELAAAYAQAPWPTGRIDRLAAEISVTEREIAALGALLPAPTAESTVGTVSESPSAVERVPSPVVAKAAPRTLTVARNKLTPFGQHVPERAGE